MAKKKAKRAAPTRNCEKCDTPYHPRSKACPKCGAANPTIGVRPGPRRKGGQVDAGALDAAIQFVETAGGFKAASAAMDRLEAIKKM